MAGYVTSQRTKKHLMNRISVKAIQKLRLPDEFKTEFESMEVYEMNKCLLTSVSRFREEK